MVPPPRFVIPHLFYAFSIPPRPMSSSQFSFPGPLFLPCLRSLRSILCCPPHSVSTVLTKTLNPQCSVFSFPITRGLRYYFFMLCYFEARSRPFLLLCTLKGPLCFRYHQSTVNLDFPLLALYLLILSIIPSMLFSPFSRLSSFSLPRLSTLQIVLILLYQL